MEKTVLISITKDELQSIMIDCFNACLKYHKTSDTPSFGVLQKKKLNVHQLSDYLNTPVNTLYGMNSRGELPGGSKVGRRLLFDKDEIDSWLLARRKKTAAEIKAEAENFLSSQK